MDYKIPLRKSTDLPYPLPDPPTFNPIIPFETLPVSVQIFLAITALVILTGCAHIVLKVVRTILNKNG